MKITMSWIELEAQGSIRTGIMYGGICDGFWELFERAFCSCLVKAKVMK